MADTVPTNAQPSAGQMDQQSVNYRTAGDSPESCAVCTHFQSPSACALVKGPISPGGICDIFTPLGDTMPPAARPGLEEQMLGAGGALPPMPGMPGVI